jgi:hypothetical protein
VGSMRGMHPSEPARENGLPLTVLSQDYTPGILVLEWWRRCRHCLDLDLSKKIQQLHTSGCIALAAR